MRAWGRFSAFLSLSIVCICACKAGTQAPTPQTTINAPQGGKIVYGAVNGATTQAAAMTKLLSTVHAKCGEKPQIGKVFQFRGTNSVGVFFTVTDHPEGNIPLAGMVIAAATGPNQVEGAMLYDVASRFGTTVNPMLQQLSSVWHPGGAGAASGSPAGATTASAAGSATGGKAAPAAALHKVTLPDNTASVGLPDGWKVVPGCAGGTMSITGLHGEVVDLNLSPTAVDPNNSLVRQVGVNRLVANYKGKVVVYPSNADLAKAFPDIWQQVRRINGVCPANIQIDHSEQIPAPQGERCVHVTGHLTDNDGKGPYEMNSTMCMGAPGQGGLYVLSFFHSVVPNAFANQDRATVTAVFASFQVNTALINKQVAATTAPVIAAMNKQVEAQAAQYINNIHQIGQQTTARINASEGANSAEQASWNAGQDANARNVQGFSNYLLDQTVVQNNDTGGHSTDWNSTADALVKANPDRFQYVGTPNYIKGTDF
jgi:hypothetical protein